DPLEVERVGADYQRGQDFPDEGEGAGLRLAAPDGGDAGLAQALAAGVVGEAHQDVLPGEVLAQRADDGDVRLDAAGDRSAGETDGGHEVLPAPPRARRDAGGILPAPFPSVQRERVVSRAGRRGSRKREGLKHAAAAARAAVAHAVEYLVERRQIEG